MMTSGLGISKLVILSTFNQVPLGTWLYSYGVESDSSVKTCYRCKYGET